jgi:predicted Rossmann fold nucleotide-binding protein DprA/Smf involved in DNA uptake
MTANTSDERTPRARSPIQILRERRGGVPKQLVARQREQLAVRRKLVDALQSGPKTVPELARQTELPRHEVFWHLMAMRKYGQVAEGEELDQFFSYALVQGPQTTEPSS